MDERGGGLDKDPSITQTASETVVSAPGDSSLLNTPDSSLVNPDVIPVVSNRFGRRSLLEGLIGVGLGITAAVVPVPKKHIPSFANETLLGRLLHRFLGTRVVRAEGLEGVDTAGVQAGGPDTTRPPENEPSAELRPFRTIEHYTARGGEVIRIINPETGPQGVRIFTDADGNPDQDKIDAVAAEMRVWGANNLAPGERPLRTLEIIATNQEIEDDDAWSRYAGFCNGQTGRQRECDFYYRTNQESRRDEGVLRLLIKYGQPRFWPSAKGVDRDLRSTKNMFQGIIADILIMYNAGLNGSVGTAEAQQVLHTQTAEALDHKFSFNINAFEVFTPYG